MTNYGLITPREYQLEALEAVSSSLQRGIKRQLICLPTGTGKTIIFALLTKEWNRRTLVLAHTEELIKQAVEKFRIVWPEVDIGIVKAELDEVDKSVVVASVQTACRNRRLQKLTEQNFGLMIIDEAHHAAAPSYEKVIKELGFLSDDSEKLLIGVTATPKRGDGVGLSSIFQEITFERSMSTMIRGGYLSYLIGKQIFTKIDISSIGLQHGDFVQSDLAKVVNIPSRNRLIVDNYKINAADRKKTLAFCVNIQHAKDLAEIFNISGISSSPIYGALDEEERSKILDDFSNGKYKVLTNCQLLTEGFDEPQIDCVIMGRPTASSALFTQMIGRGTRTFPTKNNCLVLDFTDNSSRHKICTSQNTLDGSVASLDHSGETLVNEISRIVDEDKIVDSRYVSAVRVMEEKIQNIDFFNTAAFAWTPVGSHWHLRLNDGIDVWVRKVINGYCTTVEQGDKIIQLSKIELPLDYALGVAEEWSRKRDNKLARRDAPWRSQPASQKQLEVLSRFGIKFNYGISKGQAAQLIDSKLNEPATAKQLYFLKKHGLMPKAGLSKAEASRIIVQTKACRLVA
jgi:superfamily II DNA or RNA helicase